MKIRTLKNEKLKNKRVLVRCDFNVPLDEKGEITDDFRIRQTLPTINYLLKKGAKIILMSHLGDPKGKMVENLRLTPAQDKLVEYLDLSIVKAIDWNFSVLKEWVSRMRAGEIFLLENLRFHPGEEANDEEFAKNLASLGEIYVNDAFGTCHRAHASIVGVPKFLPSCAGLLLAKEISSLSKIKEKPKRPLVLVMGGAKAGDKLKVLKSLVQNVDYVLIGGVLANTILRAKGFNVGKSLVSNEAEEILKGMDLSDKRIHLPLDVVVSDSVENPERIGEKSADGVSDEDYILDIGPQTRDIFSQTIKGAKTIFWNGPMGLFEKPQFAKGTEAVARAIAASKGLKIVGGGEAASAIESLGLADRIDHISTGGGAMLKFLAGEKLPGIEILSH